MFTWISGMIQQVIPNLPSVDQIQALFPYLSVFALGLLALGIFGRVLLGKRSSLNHSVCSAMAVFFIYITTTAIYTFHPWDLQEYLTPLPLITLAGDTLVLFPFIGTSLPLICSQVLPLLILCFLVNFIDVIVPQGNSIFSWFLLRFLMIVLSMILHLIASWAFHTFLPDVLVTYAPVILMGVLLTLLFLGVLKVLLGLVLTAVHPVLGAIYAFFFSNLFGKQITKAVFSTVLICLLFFILEHLGFVALDISQSNLITFLPMTCLTMVLWYLLGHTL